MSKYDFGRLYYGLIKSSVLLFFIIAIAIIVSHIIGYHPITINSCPKIAKEWNKFFMTIACAYVASLIFFIVQDWLPNYKKRNANKAYVQTKINEIYEKLRLEVTRHFFFEIPARKDFPINEYVKKFIADDWFTPIPELDGKSQYDKLKEDCREVKETIGELLRVYGGYLTYDEIKKLEYLSEHYSIAPYLASHLLSLGNEVCVDKNFVKAQAINIYKAYEVMQGKRFKIPHYSIEKKLKQDLGIG